MGKFEDNVFLFFVVCYSATKASVQKKYGCHGTVTLANSGCFVLLQHSDQSAGAPDLPTRPLLHCQQRLSVVVKLEARAEWWICGLVLHQWHALLQLAGWDLHPPHCFALVSRTNYTAFACANAFPTDWYLYLLKIWRRNYLIVWSIINIDHLGCPVAIFT